MRQIQARAISDLISALCVYANVNLRPDIREAIKNALKKEKSARAKTTLKLLLENADIAVTKKIPICQDTGMAVVFMEIGQNVKITGGVLKEAVDKGVKNGYAIGYLRKSVVRSPFGRKNTNTNTPAILHSSIVPGDKIKIWVMPKGFGSENKSRISMLNPGDGERGIIDFVLETVKAAGPEACPPFVLGVGIGGTFDYAAYLAKKALLKKINLKNPDKKLFLLEKKILKAVNNLKIGPMGFGGRTTALGVSVLTYPTHIAGLPVAVNVNCHATRSAYGVI